MLKFRANQFTKFYKICKYLVKIKKERVMDTNTFTDFNNKNMEQVQTVVASNLTASSNHNLNAPQSLQTQKVDKYGLVKVKNPNGQFLRNVILGLCMLFLSFGGFAIGNMLPKRASEGGNATQV